MTDWTIDFISHKDFRDHVSNTISAYGERLKPYNLEKFNANTIDPVKLIFDRAVYSEDWSTLIAGEIFRQRDKSGNNSIGYFHQNFFAYIDGCHVPPNGREGGWDVIYKPHGGYSISAGDTVHTIYVEMKNKHNTMNSASAARTYMKAQNQLLRDDDCCCFLVEAIAKESQNIPWQTTIDGRRVSHKHIRRVSIDKFYEITTGEPNAFYQICMALPGVIDEVLSDRSSKVTRPVDTVYAELQAMARKMNAPTDDLRMTLAMYMLGFSTYTGFKD